MKFDPTSLQANLEQVEGVPDMLSQVDKDRVKSCLQGMSADLQKPAVKGPALS